MDEAAMHLGKSSCATSLLKVGSDPAGFLGPGFEYCQR